MKKYHIIVIIFWIGLSLFVTIFSYKLRLGRFNNPGPGLMPFIIGIFLLIISFYLLIRSLFERGIEDKSVHKEQRQTNFGKIGLVLVSLLAYAILLETLGYLIVTLLFFILLFRSMGNRWTTVWVASVLTVLLTYFVFTFFGVKFPAGILRLR